MGIGENWTMADAQRLAQVSNKIRHVESWLLWGIVAVLVFSMGFFHGSCQTYKGITGDTGWLLTRMSDNIVIEK